MRIIKTSKYIQAELKKEAVMFEATDLNSFEDRNRLNKRIKEFKSIAKTFAYLRKYIFQNAPHAQEIVGKYLSDKRMSSYPDILEVLKRAYIKSRDNYKEFSIICDEILNKIYDEIRKMEDIRKDFSEKVLTKKLKKKTRKE